MNLYGWTSRAQSDNGGMPDERVGYHIPLYLTLIRGTLLSCSWNPRAPFPA